MYFLINKRFIKIILKNLLNLYFSSSVDIKNKKTKTILFSKSHFHFNQLPSTGFKKMENKKNFYRFLKKMENKDLLRKKSDK